jgi:Dolichyl-phosphate-mannose-protein mannosyltransferase
MILAARGQVPNMWTSAHPGYFDLGVQWDGSWYREIAEHGYPHTLPHDAAGNLQQNALAFYPAYPYLVRGVMHVTGLSFPVAGAMTSLVLGALAMLVIYQLFKRYVGPKAALVGMLVVAAFPSAPVLQISYTEAFALLLLAAALLLLVQRHYLLALPVVVGLALTRPVVLPFAAVVLVHFLVRWRQHRRDPFPPRQVLAVIVLGLVSAASAGLWPLIAWRLTGVRSAYSLTAGTWRSAGKVEYFQPWWFIATYLIHNTVYAAGALIGLGVLILAATLGPWARPLGPELRAWSLAYPAYLAAVLEPWSSIFRYALLLFPLALLGLSPVKRPRLRAGIVALVIAFFLVGQIVWVFWLLKFVPPTDYPP